MAKIIHQTMPGGRKKAGKKRVAAYARISCVKDAMLHSLSAQVSYCLLYTYDAADEL